jgi:hypothetical protein
MRNTRYFDGDQVVQAQKSEALLRDRQQIRHPGKTCHSTSSAIGGPNTSRVIDDMDVPGYRLHPLKGRVKNRWSIWVSGKWRLTVEFRDGYA